MGAIIPAILPTSRADLNEKLKRLAGIRSEVQIDIVDGRFIAPATWPYLTDTNSEPLSEEDDLAELDPFKFEVDLMVENPEEVIGRWIRAGATRITVHAETTHNLYGVIEEFQTRYGHDKDFAPELLSFGLALNITTDTALIEPFIDTCDYVQFMGIAHIGKQGEPFDERVIPKLHQFHRKYPDMPIQVDGGVSRETAGKLLEAGASRLVVGSALWKAPDIKEELDTFDNLLETHGWYS